MATSVFERHTSFMESELRSRLLEFDQSAGQSAVEEVVMAVNMRGATLHEVAPGLTEWERDLRRAAGQVNPRDFGVFRLEDGTYYQGTPPGKMPAAVRPSDGGLRVVEARSGSLDLWLEPFGMVLSALASQPATAIANALAIGGALCRVRIFRRSSDTSKDPLSGVSASQALAVLQAFDYDAAPLLGAELREETWVGQEPIGHRRPAGYVRLPDGTTVQGRRIVVITRRADGSSDVIQVDG